MPTLKRRYDSTLVDRPNGTRYAEAKEDILERAVRYAWVSFIKEFGYSPVQERTIIEALGVTGAWDVTVFELQKEARR